MTLNEKTGLNALKDGLYLSKRGYYDVVRR
jgi:hypothetical protein